MSFQIVLKINYFPRLIVSLNNHKSFRNLIFSLKIISLTNTVTRKVEKLVQIVLQVMIVTLKTFVQSVTEVSIQTYCGGYTVMLGRLFLFFTNYNTTSTKIVLSC
jgi:hypothetical protein